MSRVLVVDDEAKKTLIRLRKKLPDTEEVFLSSTVIFVKTGFLRAEE